MSLPRMWIVTWVVNGRHRLAVRLFDSRKDARLEAKWLREYFSTCCKGVDPKSVKLVEVAEVVK